MEKSTDIEKIIEQLDAVYIPLESKAHQLFKGLQHRIFETRLGWYSGHYRTWTDGKYHRDSFPILVIEVKGFCDVEINLDCVTVTAKLKRANALEYSYENIKGFSFEAYGVEDYLLDFYTAGSTVSQMKDAIRKSNETEICFSFRLNLDIDGDGIYKFVKLLRREGFYY